MTETLRVAFDTGPLHGHRTGVGAAVAAIVDGFARRSVHATGVAPVSLVPYLLSARARRDAGERRLPIPAVVAHRMWSYGDVPRVDRWLGGVDVVHGTNYVVPPSRAPSLVSVYDCWFLRHPELAGHAVARAGAVLRRRVAAGAHIHTSSHATADAVRSLLHTDRVTTVHLGPLAVATPPSLPPISALPHEPFLVAIGTRDRRKNLPRLIAAFAMLPAGCDVALVIAGSGGDDDEATAAAIERLPAAARRKLWLLGGVDAPTRSWLLHHACALAYPSLDEGFGFPVLEAQSLGVPVVGGRAGSIPEIGGRGVEYVDPLDVADIAAGLARVVSDDGRRAELQTVGHANVARFSWERTVDGLADLYADLADTGPRAGQRGDRER